MRKTIIWKIKTSKKKGGGDGGWGGDSKTRGDKKCCRSTFKINYITKRTNKLLFHLLTSNANTKIDTGKKRVWERLYENDSDHIYGGKKIKKI